MCTGTAQTWEKVDEVGKGSLTTYIIKQTGHNYGINIFK